MSSGTAMTDAIAVSLIVIESSDPKVAGYAQQAEMFADYLFETARAAKTPR